MPRSADPGPTFRSGITRGPRHSWPRLQFYQEVKDKKQVNISSLEDFVLVHFLL